MFARCLGLLRCLELLDMAMLQKQLGDHNHVNFPDVDEQPWLLVVTPRYIRVYR
jgi:hypothetical protein